MARILILYYSGYGHTEVMAAAVADGVNAVAGCEAVVKRVPELVSGEVAAAAHMKLDQAAPFASPERKEI